MCALVINESNTKALQKLKDFALRNRITLTQMQEVLNGERDPIGNDLMFCQNLDFGFRVIYSVEEQPQLGWCGHLSVSVDSPDPAACPHPLAVEMILQQLGHKSINEAVSVWIEEYDGGKAVNILSLL